MGVSKPCTPCTTYTRKACSLHTICPSCTPLIYPLLSTLHDKMMPISLCCNETSYTANENQHPCRALPRRKCCVPYADVKLCQASTWWSLEHEPELVQMWRTHRKESLSAQNQLERGDNQFQHLARNPGTFSRLALKHVLIMSSCL